MTFRPRRAALSSYCLLSTVSSLPHTSCIGRGHGLKHLDVPGARLLLFACVAAAALLLAFALWRSRRRGGPMLGQPRPLPGVKSSLDASAVGRRVDVALGREIAHLLEEGRKVEAVRLVRERTGWGAQEAGEMVTRLEGLMKRLG